MNRTRWMAALVAGSLAAASSRAAEPGIDAFGWRFDVEDVAVLFEQWLVTSRDAALARGAAPMPVPLRAQLSGFYDGALLERVRYKVGDAGPVNLAALTLRYGDAAAVTLVDVIVFSDPAGAGDPVLWAHELRHVQQFHDWGTHGFALRYVRDAGAVESEAYAAQERFAAQRQPSP